MDRTERLGLAELTYKVSEARRSYADNKGVDPVTSNALNGPRLVSKITGTERENYDVIQGYENLGLGAHLNYMNQVEGVNRERLAPQVINDLDAIVDNGISSRHMGELLLKLDIPPIDVSNVNEDFKRLYFAAYSANMVLKNDKSLEAFAKKHVEDIVLKLDKFGMGEATRGAYENIGGAVPAVRRGLTGTKEAFLDSVNGDGISDAKAYLKGIFVFDLGESQESIRRYLASELGIAEYKSDKDIKEQAEAEARAGESS